MDSQANSPSGGPAPKGLFRKILRWIFRTALLAVILVLVLVGILPFLVSAFAGKAALESQASERLAAPFSVDSVSMNWTGGFGVKNLRIDQPEGFGAGPAVQVRQALLDVGLGKLISGVYKVGVQVKGLRVALVRNKEGALNLLHLLKPAPGGGRSSRGAQEKPGKSSKPAQSGTEENPLSALQAWFKLEDAAVEVKDLSGGLSGKIALNLTVGNESPGAPFDIRGKAKLFTAEGNKAGEVEIQGALDPVQRKGTVRIRGGKMALETWRALLPVNKEVSGLEGNLGIDLEIKLQEDRVETRGKIELRDLAARLAALGGKTFRQKLWTFRPDVSVDLKKGEVDFSGFRADAGPLKIQGLAPERAAGLLPGEKAVGTLLTLDLGKLPRVPGLLPPGAEAAGKISIEAALPEGSPSRTAFRLKGDGISYASKEIQAGPFHLEGEGKADPAKGLGGIQLLLTLRGKGLAAGENLVRDVLARLSLDKGNLQARLDKAVVNGGPAKALLSLSLGKKTIPMKAEIHLDGVAVNASLAPVLAYVLPFAVSPKDALLSGKARIDFSLSGGIPLSRGLSIRRILETAKGSGELALQGLTFQGSPALKQVLAAFRGKNGYSFKGLSTRFRLDGGRILQKEIDIPHGGSKIRVSGFTDLAGNMDYSFDFGDLLKKNKKGKKLMALLGGNTLPLRLKGTIFAPKPEFKVLDLKSLLGAGQEALQKKAEKTLEKTLEKGLKSLFGRHKKKKK